MPFVLLRYYCRLRRSGPLILSVFACLAVFCYVAAWVPFAFEGWAGRAGVREAVREAKRLGLTYDDALENPTPSAGKPVRWHVTVEPNRTWHYKGRLDRPVEWSGPAPNLSPSSNPHLIAATIVYVDIDPPKVTLRYIGRG